MSPARPFYVLDPAGARLGLDALFPGREPVPVSDASSLAALPPGLLLLPIDRIADGQLLAALTVAAEQPSDSSWFPVLLLQDDGGAARLLPVSLGWPADAAELAGWLEGADDAELFELRHVLGRVAHARHDLNNPLTSAMAEIQLALLDVRDPTIRQGLETVEEQLRRMRNLIAGLQALRPPR